MTDTDDVYGRRVTIPLHNPEHAAVILSRALKPDVLDAVVALLLATPDPTVQPEDGS